MRVVCYDSESGDDEGVGSEDELDLVDENEGGGHSNAVVYHPKHHGVDPSLQVGMIFSWPKEFKAAVRAWNVKRGRTYRFVKNDKSRVKVVCRYAADVETLCQWCIYAAISGGGVLPNIYI